LKRREEEERRREDESEEEKMKGKRGRREHESEEGMKREEGGALYNRFRPYIVKSRVFMYVVIEKLQSLSLLDVHFYRKVLPYFGIVGLTQIIRKADYRKQSELLA